VSATIVELSQATVRLGWRVVLDQVNLRIRAGDRIFVFGENGAGKSTLLRAIGGVHPISGGGIHWPGKPCAFHDGSLAYLRQHHNLFPSLTLRDNIFLRPSTPPKDRAALFAAAMERFPELAQALDRPPLQASVGQRQLAACLRLLFQRPRLLILDEPTAGVNQALIPGLYDIFNSILAADSAVILTEQDSDLAAKWCNRALHLRNGHIGEGIDG
jgi:ABC-type branched-subunit amino acid transport system ATPase component